MSNKQVDKKMTDTKEYITPSPSLESYSWWTAPITLYKPDRCYLELNGDMLSIIQNKDDLSDEEIESILKELDQTGNLLKNWQKGLGGIAKNFNVEDGNVHYVELDGRSITHIRSKRIENYKEISDQFGAALTKKLVEQRSVDISCDE